jgi:uncharacterized protein
MNFRYARLLSILFLLVIGFNPSVGYSASYAPLDCTKAPTTAETTVCRNYALGQDEARLATLFEILTSLVAMGQRGDLIDTQRHWIATRDACGNDAKCLSRAYQNRINELSQALDALAKRGPF